MGHSSQGSPVDQLGGLLSTPKPLEASREVWGGWNYRYPSVSVGFSEPRGTGPWCEMGRTQGTQGQVYSTWVKVAARGL